MLPSSFTRCVLLLVVPGLVLNPRFAFNPVPAHTVQPFFQCEALAVTPVAGRFPSILKKESDRYRLLQLEGRLKSRPRRWRSAPVAGLATVLVAIMARESQAQTPLPPSPQINLNFQMNLGNSLAESLLQQTLQLLIPTMNATMDPARLQQVLQISMVAAQTASQEPLRVTALQAVGQALQIETFSLPVPNAQNFKINLFALATAFPTLPSGIVAASDYRFLMRRLGQQPLALLPPVEGARLSQSPLEDLYQDQLREYESAINNTPADTSSPVVSVVILRTMAMASSPAASDSARLKALDLLQHVLEGGLLANQTQIQNMRTLLNGIKAQKLTDRLGQKASDMAVVLESAVVRYQNAEAPAITLNLSELDSGVQERQTKAIQFFQKIITDYVNMKREPTFLPLVRLRRNVFSRAIANQSDFTTALQAAQVARFFPRSELQPIVESVLQDYEASVGGPVARTSFSQTMLAQLRVGPSGTDVFFNIFRNLVPKIVIPMSPAFRAGIELIVSQIPNNAPTVPPLAVNALNAQAVATALKTTVADPSPLADMLIGLLRRGPIAIQAAGVNQALATLGPLRIGESGVITFRRQLLENIQNSIKQTIPQPKASTDVPPRLLAAA